MKKTRLNCRRLTHTFIVSILYCPGLHSCSDPGFSSQNLKQGNIEVLITEPSGSFSMAGKSVENSITHLIDHAQISVRMAVYNFDNLPILDSLIAAKKRGVVVKIVGDFKELSSPGYIALSKEEMDLVTGNQHAIQHNKFFIIDDSIVLTGTGNFSHSDFYNNDNHFLIIRDTALAAMYTMEFEQMHAGFFSSDKSSFKMNTDWPIINLPVNIFFSPQESRLATRAMIERINSATDSIYYMIFAFSHDEIATALIQAARRGVKVYGIHDSSFVRGISQEAARIYMSSFMDNEKQFVSGPFVRIEGNTNSIMINGVQHGGKMHCKTMIIDPESSHGSVITGSFNWSNNAVENNDENLLIISDSSVIQSVKQQWDQAWKLAKSAKEEFPVPGGSTANHHDIYISEINWAGTSDGTSFFSDDDFIEIFNNSGHTIDITHWTMTWKNGRGNYISSYSFPDTNDGKPFAEAIIAPGEYRLIYGKKSNAIHAAAKYFNNGLKIPESKNFSLPDSDVTISLYDRRMILVDRVEILYSNREGELDPVLKNTASMNRRINENNQPDNVWYTSQIECNWEACLNPHVFASPGYKNENAGPVIFKTSKSSNSGNFLITFSGNVKDCINPLDYILSSDTEIISVEGIKRETHNQLRFFAPKASNHLQTYKLQSRAFPEFKGTAIHYSPPNIIMGTDSGLTMYNDVSRKQIPIRINGLENFQVNQIIEEPDLVRILVATNKGLYRADNTLTVFEKIIIDASIPHERVLAVTSNTNFLFAATDQGLYMANKPAGIFNRISEEIFFSLYHLDNFLLAGGYQGIHKFTFPYADNPLIIELPGKVNIIRKLGDTYYAGTTTGLYTSKNSNEFTSIYSNLFSNKNIRSLEKINGNFLVLTSDQLSDISLSGSLISSIFLNGDLSNLKSIVSGNFGIIGAGSYGLITGATIETLSASNQYHCRDVGHLPAGSALFQGYDFPDNGKQAKIILNEVSLVNRDNHDWIEFIAVEAGTLHDIVIEYSDGHDRETLFNFPDHYINAGEIILLYTQSAYGKDFWKLPGQASSQASPHIYYTPHANLAKGDGLIKIIRKNEVSDALYYSNHDRHIDPEFMSNELYNAYFNENLRTLILRDMPYPLSGWNDDAIQNLGIRIPDSGYERAITRSGISDNRWILQEKPTPGIL